MSDWTLYVSLIFQPEVVKAQKSLTDREDAVPATEVQGGKRGHALKTVSIGFVLNSSSIRGRSTNWRLLSTK